MNDTVHTPRRLFAPLLLAAATLLAGHARADDATLGKTLATQGSTTGVAACIGCHGGQGEGNAAAGFPRLAGTSAAYLSAQLAAFADGSRQNPVMQPLSKLLTPHERDVVSAYFASLPAPAGIAAADDTSIDPANTGAWLATRGRWSQGLPACAQCHGPGGLGVGSAFPPLAGQPAAYIAGQLNGWKHGTRPPGPMALMPAIAGKLSDADIDAVAAYYARGGAAQGDKR
ncbi:MULTISPECIES: c-type cytochrome [Burkholderia]|uniref:c-type cytochrome n=1 Tax=Burkholderia TaxID=32008 RepID=UPI0015884D7A|nr:c-type cytochrome [Burkholderia cepacia]MCA8059030.1 c-type cytochrome [Burkholderia cepacia]MCA8136581.1 c-type cytochrome [Burkholderia cepacia]MCA8163517.1 c-type cytochrome [Burkholderia cepacia]MDN7617312.1 c-type cytochrome [Burkholderia cepacia]HEM7892909.1 c-type cytochrome [Burkholderia cepacia]